MERWWRDAGALPLCIACQMGETLCAQLLLEAGAPVNQPLEESKTALFVASLHGRHQVMALRLEPKDGKWDATLPVEARTGGGGGGRG